MMNDSGFDEKVLGNTQALLDASERMFPRVGDALFAHLLTTVMLAKSVDMTLEHLLEGVGAAYRDIHRAQEQQEGAHDGN